MDFSSLQNGLTNCLNVSIRLVVFEQYFVYHSICPNCLQFLRGKAEFFVPSTLVAAMFRKSGILDRSKCRMTLLTRRNLPQGTTVMIINTGQICIVNYPGRPRMRDLKCPDWEKNRLGKKYVVGLVYQKKKQKKNGKHTAYQEITFLFHTAINNVSPFP